MSIKISSMTRFYYTKFTKEIGKTKKIINQLSGVQFGIWKTWRMFDDLSCMVSRMIVECLLSHFDSEG